MKTTSKTSLIATFAIVGAFTAGFASGPASAQNQPYRGPFQFEFKYDAAELGSLDGAQNLLARLQSDIRSLRDPRRQPARPPLAAGDRSLQLHACHGPRTRAMMAMTAPIKMVMLPLKSPLSLLIFLPSFL